MKDTYHLEHNLKFPGGSLEELEWVSRGILDTLKDRMLNLAMNLDLGLERVHNMQYMKMGEGYPKTISVTAPASGKNTHFVQE